MRVHQFNQISTRAGRPLIRFGRLTLCVALFMAMNSATAHADLASAIQNLIDQYGGIRNDKTPAGGHRIYGRLDLQPLRACASAQQRPAIL